MFSLSHTYYPSDHRNKSETNNFPTLLILEVYLQIDRWMTYNLLCKDNFQELYTVNMIQWIFQTRYEFSSYGVESWVNQSEEEKHQKSILIHVIHE